MRRAKEQSVFIVVGCIVAAALILAFAGCREVHAQQVYNGYTNEYETVPDDDGREWEPRYNAYEGTYSMQPEDADTEYNAYSGHYEWNSGHNPRRKHGRDY